MPTSKQKDPRAILRLNPEGVWLGAIYATKLMLGNFERWESILNADNKQGVVGDFTKRVSDWQEFVLQPLTVKCITRNLPAYAKSVLSKLAKLKTRNNIFELNSQLLLTASTTLVDCVTKRGTGNKTYQEISKWFGLMTALKDSPLIENAHKETKALFCQVIEAFGTAKVSANSVTEYPFFNHKILFLHISHMVYYSCVGSKSTSNTELMQVDASSFNRWEEISGRFFGKHFNAGYLGLCADGSNRGEENFPIIDLPLDWFFGQMIQHNGLPFTHDLHFHIMGKMQGKLKEIMSLNNINSSKEHDNLERFELYYYQATILINKRKPILKSREKERRCRNKKMVDPRKYKPRLPRYFERDLFHMSVESYYYHFKTSSGKASRQIAGYGTGY